MFVLLIFKLGNFNGIDHACLTNQKKVYLVLVAFKKSLFALNQLFILLSFLFTVLNKVLILGCE